MIYIVGNGMFGRIASDLLKANNIESLIIDDDQPNAGTKASGNITKPSWITGLGDAAKTAYADLDSMYGLNKFSPKVLNKTIDLFYVNREHFLSKQPDITGHVDAVGDGWLSIDQRVYQGKILIAAGVWSEQLVTMPTIDVLVGSSAIYQRPQHESQFSMWAPYKQAISYQYDTDKVWFGDGTAIKLKNWKSEEDKRLKASEERAIKQGLLSPVETHVGYRPYVKGHKNGYFAKVHTNTWISTGGGKNGIVLAMIQAQQFLKEITT